MCRMDNRSAKPIAGIILAAGGSHRLGKPKVNLDWFGLPFVRTVSLNALAAELQPVLVVCGAYLEVTRKCLENLPVQIIHNPNWQEGMSTSVHAGIRALPEDIAGAIFFMVDQPHIPPLLIKALVAEHACSQAAYVAPVVNGTQCQPVLFDRRTFPSLLQIHGDKGGRAVFHLFQPSHVVWEDERILLDVDTADDYRLLIERYSTDLLPR